MPDRNLGRERDTGQAMNTFWATQMQAASSVDPSRLGQSLAGAILGCGGWILRRKLSDTGALNILFEFERQATMNIYSMVVAAGVELSPQGHLWFTDLCQCTLGNQRDCGTEIASIDLEIQTPEMLPCRESTASNSQA